MSRRLLLVVLGLLMAIGLCAAWVVLNPAAPDQRPVVLPQIADDARPVIAPDRPPVDGSPGDPTDAAPDAARRHEAVVRPREEELVVRPDPRQVEAALEAERQAEKPLQATGEAVPNAPPPIKDNAALEAERQKRIEMLRSIKRPPNQTLGNARPRARKPAKTGKKELADVNAKLRQDRRGLYAQYYAFANNPVAELLDPSKPLLKDRTPDVTRIDKQVNFTSKQAWSDITFDKGNFVAVWEGFLVVEEQADYWLYLGADLYGNVQLNGEFVLIDDLVDYTEVSTVLTLAPGLHPIRIEYYEARNGSPVQDLGSCNLMYVPKGQSKPVPVPPEMLMLPERLWSDDAPIITHLSKTSGEIGDEITIYGQSLAKPGEVRSDGTVLLSWTSAEVYFAGQRATTVSETASAIRVRVPLGAVSGRLDVHKVTLHGATSTGPDMGVWRERVPSNSVDFSVTTQFGLYASWHNLAGWSKYDFIPPDLHEPDVVRLEREFMFESRDKLTLPFRNNPLACRWEGKLGIPSDWARDGARLVRFQSYGRLRVTLNGETKATTAPVGGGHDLSTLDFEVPAGEERYLPLLIDWTSESGPASLRVVEMKQAPVVGNHVTPIEPVWWEVRTLPAHLFFPPIIPPQPPRIVSAKPLWPEGDQPPVLPYTVTSIKPGIREGQEFEFVIEVYGNAEVRNQAVNVSVDGKPVAYEVLDKQAVNTTTERRTCKGVLPSGLGEGAMVARMAVVSSEPFYIDVTNKGLIAYLYDLPNPGGYPKMPELEPLTCFLVRKDAQVNFENANDFNLPFPAETFAVEWFGAIIVEREGDYTFTCRSDDGVLVWVNGNLVLEDDNLHYQREKSGPKVHLTPGVHTFRMQFFENNVHEVSVLYWQGSDAQGEFLPKQVIPKASFTWDTHPPLPSKISTGKRADGSDPQ